MINKDNRAQSYSKPNDGGPKQTTTAQASREADAAKTGDRVLILRSQGRYRSCAASLRSATGRRSEAAARISLRQAGRSEHGKAQGKPSWGAASSPPPNHVEVNVKYFAALQGVGRR